MLSGLEQALGYQFQNVSLLENALRHTSYANEMRMGHLGSNERLEFLGDSILGFVVAEYLFRRFPELPEGELTRIRAELVCEGNLAQAAEQLGLGKYLLLGNGEAAGGGRKRESINADAMESIFAATYLDGGFAQASGLIHRLLLQNVNVQNTHNTDYKTALQEVVQRRKDQTLRYSLVEESGPDHDKKFRVVVLLNEQVIGEGVGRSKKRAEQAAAAQGLQTLKQ